MSPGGVAIEEPYMSSARLSILFFGTREVHFIVDCPGD